MDMTYITCLLKDGFGFKESSVLQVQPLQTRGPIRVVVSENRRLSVNCDSLSLLFHPGEQEGEQRGVELGFGSHIGLFLQPEHPLR